MFKSLYPYQEKYLANMPRKAIFNSGLGTGKTAMSIVHYFRTVYPEPLLVVAPASKIRTNDWQQEFEEICNMLELEIPEVEFISYERLRVIKAGKPKWFEYKHMKAIITDEIHALKNPQALQSKAIQEITKDCNFFIGLSGTLMPNGWIDFAGYSKLFGFTKGVTEFKNKYCRIERFKGFPEIKGYYHIDELKAQLASIAHPLSREQALELPSRQFIGKTLEMNSKTAKRYYNLKLTRTDTNTGELVDNSTRLASLLRQTTTNSRIDEMMSIVNDTDENIVIFYNYISEREAILKELKKTKKKILRYDGEKHDILPKANANINNTVLVAHYKSASTGLNLQFASVTIFFSLTYSFQEYSQAVGRTHRTGQTKRCLFYVLKVKNTIDDNILQALKNKQDFNVRLWAVDK